jgi:hypothetical protein
VTREEVLQLTRKLTCAHRDIAHTLVVRVLCRLLYRLVRNGALTPEDVREILD